MRKPNPTRPKPAAGKAAAAPRGSPAASALVSLSLAAWSALAVWFFHSHGWQYFYGDAEAHLNIARRIADNLTPGYDQVGTVWLPLPHWLMLPLVRLDPLWRNGLAGAIPSAACFVLAGSLLFAAVRRLFGSTPAALAAVALLALNPNLMYLQSTAMTEAVFMACLMGVFYCTVRFAEGASWWAAAGAGIAALAGTLTRYEGWFLIPFVALYLLLVGKQRRIPAALVFAGIASLGPLFWLGHNWWLSGDPLEFFRGPYSARAIQRGLPYPGMNDWLAAFRYFRSAAQLCAGLVLPVLALAGAAVALARRKFWPLALLALPAVFYIWSVHSSGTPIFVPTLPPFSHYNTRYGLVALPLLVVAAAGLVTLVPLSTRPIVAALVVAAATAPWLLYPRPATWVTWEESRVNSQTRLAWTAETAAYLGPRYRPGSGILTSFGDMTAVYRRLGIPLRDTFTGDNGLFWLAATRRPELFTRQGWAVLRVDDPMWQAIQPMSRAGTHYTGTRYTGTHYTLEKTILVDGAPAIQIFRR
jgi:4-amino-4-deoxy-L-arabinose transferase-like glycosyltransferase